MNTSNRSRTARSSIDAPTQLLAPIEAQEVWAAGVTYYRSRAARMAESHDAGGGDFYDRVYSAERPELFSKATAHRVVGPNAPVRIRRDSKWNVPEPELTLLISPAGNILGYTAGNDMSSRDIEGKTPLPAAGQGVRRLLRAGSGHSRHAGSTRTRDKYSREDYARQWHSVRRRHYP